MAPRLAHAWVKHGVVAMLMHCCDFSLVIGVDLFDDV
jgi:hypothetical protein